MKNLTIIYPLLFFLPNLQAITNKSTMFIGHYSAAFALKAYAPKASLGMLFIATQFVDILLFSFVNLGIEHLEIIPFFTPSTHFDLQFYPYTHGLASSLGWAFLFYIIYSIKGKKKKRNNKVPWVMALAVLSHWFADLIVHTPDLPLLGDGSLKVGIGLWRNQNATFLVEVGLLVLSWFYYLRKSKGNGFWGKYGSILFISLLIFAAFLNLFVLPPPTDTMSLMTSALVAYGFFAVLAAFMGSTRSGVNQKK